MSELSYIKVNAKNFTGGVQIEDGRCVNASTILRYTIGWREERVRAHFKRRKWKTEEMNPEQFGRA